MLGAMDLY